MALISAFNTLKHFDKYGMIGDYHPKGATDELGRLITTEWGWVDGGDTLQRMGTYFLARVLSGENIDSHFIQKYEKVYNQLQISDGNYRRHPDPDFWYSDSDRMSRDQLIPNLVLWGLFDKKRLFRFFIGHLKRGLLFTTNTRRNGATKENHGTIYKYVNGKPVRRNYNLKLPDLTGPSIWAKYIRGFNLLPLYPLLMILDIEYFINSILKRTLAKNDNDIINHCIEGIYSSYKMTTPLIWIANKFINDANDLCNRLDKYFGDNKDPKFLGEMLKPLIKKYIG